MKTKKWYHKNGLSYEIFNILYEDNGYILIQNSETKSFTFGLSEDFGTLLGFPINQSGLTKEECINKLTRFIKINEKYNDINKTTKIYEDMIKVLKGGVKND